MIYEKTNKMYFLCRTGLMVKDNQVFYFIKAKVFFIYYLTTHTYWRSQEHTSRLSTHLYDHYILNFRSSFTRQRVQIMPNQTILVRKVNIHVYSMAVTSSTFCLFVLLLYIRPKSVHLTTHFSWTSLNKQLTSTSCTYFRL